ncbi:hypothetical protein CISG_06327 [Coccidioides immitis RMSCC 3703]|uniref:Uncharacterized protein n=1 Tax=Coccidioides immitis RMSCC 3703 TaxID=454286 RepID=A0A0J8QXU8_COCIT|nr:hypothetical protein CISG_06327 [Coccidioides immitis RMSCC 3703]
MKPSYILSLLGLQVASVMAIPVESDALSTEQNEVLQEDNNILAQLSNQARCIPCRGRCRGYCCPPGTPTAFGLVAAAGVRAAKQVRPRGIAWLCSMT